MDIVVGLGNPGKKFENTRHNVGFMVLEEMKKIQKSKNPKLQTNYRFKFSKRFKAEVLLLAIQNDKRMLLAKPKTFMNSSGEAVKKILQYYNPQSCHKTAALPYYRNLYIIHDDLDIHLGEYRIQFGRGAAGHHGVESIIKELETKDFWRLRIGIKSQNSELESEIKSLKSEQYVLEKFTKKEKEILDKAIQKATADLKKRILEKKD